MTRGQSIQAAPRVSRETGIGQPSPDTK